MTNRRLRHACAACVAFVVLAGTAALAANWPQHRGNSPHTAAITAPTPNMLVPLWSVRFYQQIIDGTTYKPGITSSPAVVNGVVYIGCQNTKFYALDASTGSQLWEYPANSPIESSPMVRDGVVYFVSDNGNLTALNTADGAEIWKFNSGGWQDRVSPNISGSNVICGAAYPKTHIYAVPVNSSGTASEAWHVTTSQFVHSSPAVDPATGNIFCGSNDGKIYAIKPDGTDLWPSPFSTIGGILRASPTIANDKVYISGGDYDWALHAIDAATGILVWDAPMVPKPDYPSYYYRGIQVSSPAVDNDFVAIIGGYGKKDMGSSTLYAFRDNGTSATQLWTLNLPNSVGVNYVSSPVLTPSSVVVGVAENVGYTPTQGHIYVADRETGQAHWYQSGLPTLVGGPILSSVAIADDLLVAADINGQVTAYRLAVPGDMDSDLMNTVRDVVVMGAYSSDTGIANQQTTDRADVEPATTPRADGTRSFGDSLITPADADRVLKRALGLETRWP